MNRCRQESHDCDRVVEIGGEIVDEGGQVNDGQEEHSDEREECGGLKSHACSIPADGRLRWYEKAPLACGRGSLPAAEREYRSEERRVGKECRSRWSPY